MQSEPCCQGSLCQSTSLPHRGSAALLFSFTLTTLPAFLSTDTPQMAALSPEVSFALGQLPLRDYLQLPITSTHQEQRQSPSARSADICDWRPSTCGHVLWRPRCAFCQRNQERARKNPNSCFSWKRRPGHPGCTLRMTTNGRGEAGPGSLGPWHWALCGPEAEDLGGDDLLLLRDALKVALGAQLPSGRERCPPLRHSMTDPGLISYPPSFLGSPSCPPSSSQLLCLLRGPASLPTRARPGPCTQQVSWVQSGLTPSPCPTLATGGPGEVLLKD